jgi:thioredoxin reductase
MSELFDLTIIGAGPTGLYAAYYAGFRTLKVKVIDSLGDLGGQVTALYPEKFIYDVAGFPKIYGKDLVKNLVEQAKQYNPTICLNENVHGLAPRPDKTYELTTQTARHFSKAVLITIGVGAFNPKRIPVVGIERWEGRGLAYFVPDISVYDKQRVLIVGGGDSAVDWALNLQGRAKSVTLAHRRDGFRAHEESVNQLKQSKTNLKLFYEVKEVRGANHVDSVVLVNNKTKSEEIIPVDQILACLGFEASVGPIATWGLKMDRNDIVVSTKMETNLPGIYAAGDVSFYPGKLKLIATGFGEAATAVNNAAAYLHPGANVFPGHSSNQK